MIAILKEDIGKTYSTNMKDFNRPYNNYFDLTITKEIEEAVNNFKKDPIFVYQDDDALIRSVVNGEDDVYENNKYKKLQYYVLKLQSDSFHCDARVIYDKEAEEADKKAEELRKAKEDLQKLINDANALDKSNKTDESKKDLADDIKKAEEVIKGDDINAIRESIEDLSNINLVDIVVTKVYVTNNKESYYDNQSFDITVTYDNNNNEKGLVAKNYEVTEKNNTPGNHTATVTYGGKTAEFSYKVLKTEITSITVTGNKKEYFLKEKSAGITVNAKFNNGTERALNTSEYSLKGFNTNTTTYYTYWFKEYNDPREATVTAGKAAPVKFKYTVGKQTEEEYINEVNNAKLDKISIHVSDGKIEFKNAAADVEIKEVSRVNKKIFGNDKVIKINLININQKHKFGLNSDDYSILRNTNTFFANQYIRIKYSINGREYTREYWEIFGDVV